jgi:hypothetical protein
VPYSPVEGGIYHYHYNHLGSVQVVTDANGAVAEYIRYKPYVKRRRYQSGHWGGRPLGGT